MNFIIAKQKKNKKIKNVKRRCTFRYFMHEAKEREREKEEEQTAENDVNRATPI